MRVRTIQMQAVGATYLTMRVQIHQDEIVDLKMRQPMPAHLVNSITSVIERLLVQVARP